MAGPAFRAAAVRVRVPASSANLGPGFDALGLALGLYDDVVVRVADSGLNIDIAGEGADTLPRDESHLLVRSMRTAFDLLGGQPRGLEVVCANRIPHGRGLGSSSAAICAGIVAARAVTIGGEAKLDDAALLELATEIEGHPDNVAACLLGGFTLAWMDGGSAKAIRMEPAESIVPVVFVPSRPVLTETARGLLPRTVPHVDAAANAGRAGLLVEALTRRPELLLLGHRRPAPPGVPVPGDARERGTRQQAAGGRDPRGHLRRGPHGPRAGRQRRGRQGRAARGRGMGGQPARPRRRGRERTSAGHPGRLDPLSRSAQPVRGGRPGQAARTEGRDCR